MRHCSLMVRNLLMQHIGSPQHICITGPGEFSRAGFQIKGMVLVLAPSIYVWFQRWSTSGKLLGFGTL